MTDSGAASELQADEGVPDASAEAARTPLWRRLAILDWIAIALFVLGWTAVATGLLPAHDARATVTRILPCWRSSARSSYSPGWTPKPSCSTCSLSA